MAFSFATVFIPQGWFVVGQGTDFMAMGPADKSGVVIVQADPAPSGVTTNMQLDQALLVSDQKGDPSASFCQPTSQGGLNGDGGVIPVDSIFICENFTPQNGAAFQAIDSYAAGVAKGPDGGLKIIFINVFAPAGTNGDSFNAFANTIPMQLIAQTVFKNAGPP